MLLDQLGTGPVAGLKNECGTCSCGFAGFTVNAVQTLLPTYSQNVQPAWHACTCSWPDLASIILCADHRATSPTRSVDTGFVNTPSSGHSQLPEKPQQPYGACHLSQVCTVCKTDAHWVLHKHWLPAASLSCSNMSAHNVIMLSTSDKPVTYLPATAGRMQVPSWTSITPQVTCICSSSVVTFTQESYPRYPELLGSLA
jgi:hypothetical protein